jgi:YD repeat-containing protein
VLTWWVDGVEQYSLTELDTDSQATEAVSLGFLEGTYGATSGTVYFDSFVSHRTSYIGLASLSLERVLVGLPGKAPKAFAHGERLLEVGGPARPLLFRTAQLEASPVAAPLSDGPSMTVTVSYIYDPLNRLTEATYSDGTFYRYTYDAVGNRTSEATPFGTVTSTYDAANRLSSVGGVAYTWDANGNLLGDGVRTYGYNHANRLSQVVQGGDTYTFGYDGLGNRYRQTANGSPTTFVLDTNAPLTQVLSDGADTYLYGVSRIAQVSATSREYFLGDALGSVRLLVDEAGEVVRTQSYQPYGEGLAGTGTGTTSYGFAGEW